MEEINYKFENLKSTLNKIKNEITSLKEKEKEHEILTKRSEKSNLSYKIFRTSSYNKKLNQYNTSQNLKTSKNYFKFNQKEKNFFDITKKEEKINPKTENNSHQNKYLEKSTKNNTANPKILNQKLIKYMRRQSNKDYKNKTSTQNCIKKNKFKRVNDYFLFNYNKNHKEENISNSKTLFYTRNGTEANFQFPNMSSFNYNINNKTCNELFFDKKQKNNSLYSNQLVKLFQCKKRNNSSTNLPQEKKYFNHSVDSKLTKINSSRNNYCTNNNYVNLHTDHVSQVNFPITFIDKNIFDLNEEEKLKNRYNKSNVNILNTEINYKAKLDNYSNKNNKKLDVSLSNLLKIKNKSSNNIEFEEDLIKQKENNDLKDDTYGKAKLFNKYGYKTYKKFLECVGEEDSLDNLLKYRNYIINVKEEEGNFLKQINIYKNFCKKFIEIMTKDEVNEIVEEVKKKFIRNDSDNYIYHELDNFLLLTK